MAHYRFGHGSPIVLVTEFRAALSEWNAAFLAELAKHHDVIVFDNRGVGRSILDATSFAGEDMARDTAALIEALKLRRPTVVGWSMGGSIVQRLATDDPGAIGRMILMSALAPGAAGVPLPPDVEATLSGSPSVTFDDVSRRCGFRSSERAGSGREDRDRCRLCIWTWPSPLDAAVARGRTTMAMGESGWRSGAIRLTGSPS